MKSTRTGRSARALRVTIVCVPLVIAALITFVACSADRPQASDNGGGPTVPSGSCGTPNEGCDCSEPGQVVECGEVKRTTPDGHIECQMGHRTCIGTHWGACIGERDVIRQSLSTGVGTLGLGMTAMCGVGDAGGPANACDPYCNTIIDDPGGLPCTPGSVGMVDGGFGVCPIPAGDGGSDAGGEGGLGNGGRPPTINTTATGDTTCGGANAHKPTCTLATAAVDCQQDFRCDPTSLTCVWNGADNYFDSTAAGTDLTVGTACTNGTTHLPVCNRGTVAVGVGATINVNLVSAAGYAAWNTGACPTLPGPPDCAITLAAPLNPGDCTDITGCNVIGSEFAIINSEALPITEGAGRCANNAALVNVTPGPAGCAACTMCNTKLTGKVYDPSGFGGAASNNLPLAGVSVIEAAGTPPVMTDGVQCDNCANLEGPSVVKAVTDATGSFSIDGVTPGANIKLTIQSGRWRRRISLPMTACATNTPAAGTFRLPQSRTDGLGGQADIPKTAIVTANQESIECLFAKMGVATAEITSPTAAVPGRIHLFKDKGMSAPTATPAPTALWASQAALDVYTASLYPCSASAETSQGMSAAQVAFYAAHAGKGGHVLFNHHGADALFYNASQSPVFASTSTFQAGGAPSNFKMLVKTGTFPQQQLYDWLNLYGGMATYGAPYLAAPQGANQAKVANPMLTTEWLGGRGNNMWVGVGGGQDFVGSYSFEMGNVAGTPTVNADCGVAGGHGRVFFNGMHVSTGRGTTSGTFPGSCTLATGLTETEKALEFHIFQLTACQLGGAPPPPAAPPLPTVTFTRDYQAICPSGTRVKWAPFYWEGVVPPGTSIDFRAVTGEDADAASMFPLLPPPAPGSAFVGTATPPGAVAPAWDCRGCPGSPVTVDSELVMDTMTMSKPYLRVYMKFNPTGLLTPLLTNWRQDYDCVPAE